MIPGDERKDQGEDEARHDAQIINGVGLGGLGIHGAVVRVVGVRE